MSNELPPEEILTHAISKKVCISAVYNKKRSVLAPHIVYTKHDELFLGAVTVEQDGRKPRESKLGTFKLKGLTDIELTRKLFRPHADFRAGPDLTDKTVLRQVA